VDEGLPMNRALKLMLLFARVSIQNFAAYRMDLFIRPFVSLMHLASELMAIWIIFTNTQNIRGWRWQHMLVIAGVYRIVAGGIRIYIVPNMRMVLDDIRNGGLDFVLLRPVNSQLLVSIREVVIWRVVDLILGFTVAVYGCIKLSGSVPISQLVTFAALLAAAFVIVYSIWLALATLCFWFVRIANIEMIFWNVFEAGKYPIMIYPTSIRWTLTFVIPLAFITTLPAAAFVGETNQLLSAAPLWAAGLAVSSFFLSGWFWRFGLRRYSGASA
jgi:ABC-2 type transport system permease protein